MEQNNSGYSVKAQSTKGLSTFVLTLSISLIVFSTIYYLMTTRSPTQDDFTAESVSQSKVTEEESASQPVTVNTKNREEVKGKDTKTVFGEIADAKPNTTYRQVLAGSDVASSETTQTTMSNLETGVTSVTAGLISAFILFVSGMIFIYRNPRKLALNTFEKKMTKGL